MPRHSLLSNSFPHLVLGLRPSGSSRPERSRLSNYQFAAAAAAVLLLCNFTATGVFGASGGPDADAGQSEGCCSGRCACGCFPYQEAWELLDTAPQPRPIKYSCCCRPVPLFACQNPSQIAMWGLSAMCLAISPRPELLTLIAYFSVSNCVPWV